MPSFLSSGSRFNGISGLSGHIRTELDGGVRLRGHALSGSHGSNRRSVRKSRQRPKSLQDLDFERLVRRVRDVSDAFIDRVDWAAMGLAGCSVCLCQLTSSLYFIREIKKRAPDLPIIAGGSIIGGHSARDLLDAFPEIEMIVVGEGEIPLTRLVAHLRGGGRLADFPPTAGIVTRKDGPLSEDSCFSQLSDMAELPAPDFSEYFAMLKRLSPEQAFFPTLPLEISRGCWWRAGIPEPERGAAPFAI